MEDGWRVLVPGVLNEGGIDKTDGCKKVADLADIAAGNVHAFGGYIKSARMTKEHSGAAIYGTITHYPGERQVGKFL